MTDPSAGLRATKKLRLDPRMSRSVIRGSRRKGTRTLRYDWFLSDDGTECEVHEAYVDADALVEHAQHVGEARDKLFRDFAAGHHMTFYEEPSPALAEAMKAIPPGAVKVTQFSFFQGLDADVSESARGCTQ